MQAALNPIYGAERISRFFFGIMRKWTAASGIEPVNVNGRPGFALTVGEQIHSVVGFDTFSFSRQGRVDNLLKARS